MSSARGSDLPGRLRRLGQGLERGGVYATEALALAVDPVLEVRSPPDAEAVQERTCVEFGRAFVFAAPVRFLELHHIAGENGAVQQHVLARGVERILAQGLAEQMDGVGEAVPRTGWREVRPEDPADPVPRDRLASRRAEDGDRALRDRPFPEPTVIGLEECSSKES